MDGLGGTTQLAVMTLVFLITETVGTTFLITKAVLVVVMVTRFGTTVFVGLIVTEGTVTVDGARVMLVVSVVVAVLC